MAVGNFFFFFSGKTSPHRVIHNNRRFPGIMYLPTRAEELKKAGT